MTNLIKAAGCNVEAYWPLLMTKMISNVGMETLIKLGSGAGGGGSGGGGGGGAAAAGGGDAGGDAAAETKKVEEEEEEELHSAESEAKCAAAEQVEVLRQQLARLDSKRSRDEKEAKHSEEMNQRHTEFLRWVASQCAAALGEALDTNVSEDLTRQLVSRVTSQRGRQLQEGRHAEVKTDKSERSEKSENLHTEWRGRVRAAEQAQKKMQRLMQKEAEAQEAQREMQTEEMRHVAGKMMVELKLRVNALQRAKEVSERFVEEEEESWLQSKAQLREAETEALSAMASARHFEAEARCASADAVRAQAKATGAEAAQRRLQAEVESLQREVWLTKSFTEMFLQVSLWRMSFLSSFILSCERKDVDQRLEEVNKLVEDHSEALEHVKHFFGGTQEAAMPALMSSVMSSAWAPISGRQRPSSFLLREVHHRYRRTWGRSLGMIGFGGDPSSSATALIQRLGRQEIGPVLSLRSALPGCKGADLHALLSALDGYEHVHFLSFGCNGALASSKSLASLLVQVLQKGFIWACDFGEVYFNEQVFDHLLSALDPPLPAASKRKRKRKRVEEQGEPSSNLAFSFADQGCGLKVQQISRLKDLTRRRRLLDKALSWGKVDRSLGGVRTHAPWLDIPRVFGMVMRSKNLTKCFWRPYQEAEFWRRAGFHCTGGPRLNLQRSGGKRVNPSIRRLTTAMHRGNLEPAALQKAFPPGDEGERRSRELLQTCGLEAVWRWVDDQRLVGLTLDLPPAPLPRWVLPVHGAASAPLKRREERQPVLQQGLLKRPRIQQPVAAVVQQTWRDAAVLEEVSAAQQQMGHWRNEAERSCVELTKLRASCEQLQLQSAEQAKVEEAKRRLMQQALKEQAQEMQREFDQALREVQDLRDKQSFQLQEKAQELRDNENAVSTLTSELEDLRSKQVESDSRLEQLQDELSKSADLLHSSEALMQEWQNEAQQQKEQLSEEVFELHQSYAKRLQNLRAQHGGEKRAFQAVEDELRQIYTQEVQVCRRNQEAWAEATEAALAGEAANGDVMRGSQDLDV
eukprot:s3602_g1.t6